MPRKTRSAKPTDADFRGDGKPILMERPVEVAEEIPFGTPLTREGKRMPIIDPSEWDLDNIPELKILPAGSEVRLRIIEVTLKEDTSHNMRLALRLDVTDEPMIKEIYWGCNVPGGSGFSDKRNFTLRRNLSEMFAAFKFNNSSQNDTADWLGEEAWAILSVVPPSEDGKYSEKNEVARWLNPK